MPRSADPKRLALEQAWASEVARLGGADLVDWRALVATAIAAGAGRTAAYRWMAELREGVDDEPAPAAAPPPPAPAPPAALPPVRPSLPPPAATAPSAPPAPAPAHSRSECRTPAAGVPEFAPFSSVGILAGLQSIAASLDVIRAATLHPDGRMKNMAMALKVAAESRRLSADSVKLSHAIANIELVERFMAEMLGVVAELEPAAARRVVEAMQAVQARWAA